MITVELDEAKLAQQVAERLVIMLPAEERLLTREQAAERLAIGRTTLDVMIASGELRTVGEGKLRRIRLGALIDWMKANERRA